VAQAGYELGFSNLSHFSRLFEKHYGQNPKKFSAS
jgi:AraC-like DNA-binding protein